MLRLKKGTTKKIGWTAMAFAVLLMMGSCGSNDKFDQVSKSEFFTVDYNPQRLDVLWMINNQSPMYNNRTNLINEASSFFKRLDTMTNVDYRMAFVSQDMQFAKGSLQPRGNPQVLTKGLGTVDERTQYFGSIVSQIINLNTSAVDQGFESVNQALTNYFIPEPGVPLVLVFIDYMDEHSMQYQPDAQQYKTKFLSFVNNNASLLKVYSVNYTQGGKRCAAEYGSDIDSTDLSRPFNNNYFNLATLMGGSTADLCGTFSSQIDLTGLKLKTLPSTFALKGAPKASSISVSVYLDGVILNGNPWTYDAATNSIKFTNGAPQEGSTIQVNYQVN